MTLLGQRSLSMRYYLTSLDKRAQKLLLSLYYVQIYSCSKK